MKSIKKGEIIHLMNGLRLKLKDFIEVIASGNERLDDPLQIGRRTYIDLEDFSRSFNHSCKPNAAIRKNCELFAIKPIHSGEEITYDYSATIAPTVWAMNCECGSPNCRKILGDILTIPKEQLAEYRRMGALQNYMRRLLREIDNGTYRIPEYEIAALEKLGMPLPKPMGAQ